MISPRISTAVVGLAAVCALSACSASEPPIPVADSSPTAQATTGPADQQGQQDRPQQDGSRGQRMPGVQGLIAQIDGSTMQVQGSDGQTAVAWTDDTTFTRQAAGSAEDILAGACITAFGDAAEGSDGVRATRVTLTDAVDGECSAFGGVFPGGGGTPPSGMPSDAPQPPDGQAGEAGGTPPSGAPSGGPGGAGIGNVVSGEVVRVDGSTITVEQAPPGADATTATFTLTDDATITATVDANAEDAIVGQCVSTQGETDDVGAVTATTIRLSEAVDGQCTGGRR
ncbi:MAG: hypothetical protein IPJ61_07585 [Tessaracoccus sp.]|uniref:hypothetical protein n=1 Tax=Tessaracoccus sp. TaxID=1971211 RepID=UPI001EC7986C|nr:hypothetical protein [Tessaracoccus sp.]MBK7820933.1 hypothetical protein [Tessaracoccus sp.]